MLTIQKDIREKKKNINEYNNHLKHLEKLSKEINFRKIGVMTLKNYGEYTSLLHIKDNSNGLLSNYIFLGESNNDKLCRSIGANKMVVENITTISISGDGAPGLDVVTVPIKPITYNKFSDWYIQVKRSDEFEQEKSELEKIIEKGKQTTHSDKIKKLEAKVKEIKGVDSKTAWKLESEMDRLRDEEKEVIKKDKKSEEKLKKSFCDGDYSRFLDGHIQNFKLYCLGVIKEKETEYNNRIFYLQREIKKLEKMHPK